MGRAERRAAAERKKGKARRLLTSVWRYGPDFATPYRVGRYATDMKECSCLGCGNPRPHSGASHAERRQSAAGAETNDPSGCRARKPL